MRKSKSKHIKSIQLFFLLFIASPLFSQDTDTLFSKTNLTNGLTVSIYTNNMKFKYSFFIFLIFVGCSNHTKDKAKNSHKIIYGSKIQKNIDHKSSDLIKNESVIDGAIGIITVSSSYQFGDTITVYDLNKKVLSEIKIIEEYQILALQCLFRDDNFFKVKLDNGKIGLISKKSKVVFNSWEEHILNLFSVGFDINKNPLLKKPYRNSDKINFDNNEFYFPNKIQGEWLQLKWGPDNNLSYGWIRWKEKNKLIIEMFYFA